MTAFEDSPEPFHPNDPEDRIVKPKVGDTIVAGMLIESLNIPDLPMRGFVIRVFDSLAEDWSSDGETAWAMHDLNHQVGHRGRWYVLFEDGDGETYCAASYEVTEVIPA